MDDRHAIDEGEGYANAAEFRVAHERFWNGYLDDLRARLGDPAFAITDDTLVTAERFRVVAAAGRPARAGGGAAGRAGRRSRRWPASSPVPSPATRW